MTLSVLRQAPSPIRIRRGKRLDGQLLWAQSSLRRWLSTDVKNDTKPDEMYVKKYFVTHRRGDAGYGSREYLLLPPGTQLEDAKNHPSIKAAGLLAHRNIMFGARSFHEEYRVSSVCMPLVELALKDCSSQGEQPQAIASLNGLCEWVQKCLQDGDGSSSSEVLAKLKKEDVTAWEAVQAIATGIPRKGHSVIGVGTFRDGEKGWKALAREFVDRKLAEEVALYQKFGGQIVGIEHLADKNPSYLKSAGGAMARVFFL